MAIYRTDRPTEQHGMSKTRLYHIYAGMIQRCYDCDHESYRNYGARGITVCKAWRESPKKFMAWALTHGYEEHLSIERTNNDSNYSPKNCTWADALTQAQNSRNALRITAWNETKTASAWARDPRAQVTDGHITARIKAGLEPERAIALPRGATINHKKPGRFASDFTGVNLHSQTGRWQAMCQGKYIGIYATQEEAARAYDRVARQTWGKWALLNFPAEWPSPFAPETFEEAAAAYNRAARGEMQAAA